METSPKPTSIIKLVGTIIGCSVLFVIVSSLVLSFLTYHSQCSEFLVGYKYYCGFGEYWLPRIFWLSIFALFVTPLVLVVAIWIALLRNQRIRNLEVSIQTDNQILPQPKKKLHALLISSNAIALLMVLGVPWIEGTIPINDARIVMSVLYFVFGLFNFIVAVLYDNRNKNVRVQAIASILVSLLLLFLGTLVAMGG